MYVKTNRQHVDYVIKIFYLIRGARYNAHAQAKTSSFKNVRKSREKRLIDTS